MMVTAERLAHQPPVRRGAQDGIKKATISLWRCAGNMPTGKVWPTRLAPWRRSCGGRAISSRRGHCTKSVSQCNENLGTPGSLQNRCVA